MTSHPPPYGQQPHETKGGIYPEVHAGDPHQQPSPAGGYYPPGPQPQPAGSPGYYPQQPQQQQFTVVAPPPRQPVQSFVCHIVLSCFVTWCCGCICGVIAFILAMVAQSKAPNDPEGARSMGVASIALSITGIVVTVLIVIIIVVLWAVGFVLVASACPWGYIDGMCYSDRRIATSRSSCSLTEHWYRDYCYYN